MDIAYLTELKIAESTKLQELVMRAYTTKEQRARAAKLSWISWIVHSAEEQTGEDSEDRKGFARWIQSLESFEFRITSCMSAKSFHNCNTLTNFPQR